MVAAGIGYLARFLVCSMTAARYFRAQAPLYAASTLVCAAACYWLIPRYGLLGAAWATGAATSSLLLGAAAMNYYAVRRRERGGELPPVVLATPESPSG
jgi:O-antigen/teichoic acid export membrane protein